MTVVTIMTPRPVQFDSKTMVQCDGCGVTAAPFASDPPGWFRGNVVIAGAELVTHTEDRVDYCGACWPKIRATMQGEAKAIAAEKVAAAAEVSGVSA